MWFPHLLNCLPPAEPLSPGLSGPPLLALGEIKGAQEPHFSLPYSPPVSHRISSQGPYAALGRMLESQPAGPLSCSEARRPLRLCPQGSRAVLTTATGK